MSTLLAAIYTEVEPATETHGTQVVARMAHQRVAVPYPAELSGWEEIHSVAVSEFLGKYGQPGKSRWVPALFSAGVIWVHEGDVYEFEGKPAKV